MPFLLVLIRKQKWQQGPGDIPADCLWDLRTTDNELSAWYVDDHRTNLERVLTALAANREILSNVDYVLFDYVLPSRLSIKIQKTRGVTPDGEANDNWHYDLKELSGQKLLELANEIFKAGITGRILEKKVGQLIKAGVAAEQLQRSLLKPKLAAKLFPSASDPAFKEKIQKCWKCIREVFAPTK